MEQQFTQTKKPIEEASDADLRGFLLNVLQIEGATKLKDRAKLLAEIEAAGWKQPHILVLTEAETNVPADETKPRRVPQQIANSHYYKDDPIVLMTINETPLPGGNEPAYPSVNGRALLIPRGKLCAVPYRFYRALKDSHEIRVTQNPETFEFIKTKITNFPIEVEEMPSRKEIEAWEERTADKVLGA